jgi:hypothetical protein
VKDLKLNTDYMEKYVKNVMIFNFFFFKIIKTEIYLLII